MIISVVGACGKLGSSICELLTKNNIAINKIDTTINSELQDFPLPDAVIDASTPQQSLLSAQFCSSKNLPLLIACTGHSNLQLAQLEQICNNIAYCICPNRSVGIGFVCKALSHLPMLGNPYINIVETHHIHKKDSPSGTAKLLQKQIYNTSKINANVVSFRQGDEVGIHTINITLADEEITITHKAKNRNLFAYGAMLAIRSLTKKEKGKYQFLSLIGD